VNENLINFSLPGIRMAAFPGSPPPSPTYCQSNDLMLRSLFRFPLLNEWLGYRFPSNANSRHTPSFLFHGPPNPPSPAVPRSPPLSSPLCKLIPQLNPSAPPFVSCQINCWLPICCLNRLVALRKTFSFSNCPRFFWYPTDPLTYGRPMLPFITNYWIPSFSCF